MLKIAIAGCGKVADQHVHAIRRIPDCEIVSLCDREPLMAKQLGERFDISACFSDLAEMLQVSCSGCGSHHYSAAKSLCSSQAVP